MYLESISKDNDLHSVFHRLEDLEQICGTKICRCTKDIQKWPSHHIYGLDCLTCHLFDLSLLHIVWSGHVIPRLVVLVLDR